MTIEVEFGDKPSADTAREEFEEYLCGQDDRRMTTVRFVEDTPDAVLDQIEAQAMESRAVNEQGSVTADLSERERERISDLDGFDQTTTTLSWESAKGVFAREGLTDQFHDAMGALTDYDDPAEGAEEWVARYQESGQGGGARDHGHEDEQHQRRAAEAARRVQGEGCEHAREHCEHGDPEACEFLRTACGYDEEEVEQILGEADTRHEDSTEQQELVTVGGGEFPEMEVTPAEATALRKAWKSYKAGIGNIEDALDELREETINARQAISTINQVRSNYGRDDIHPNRLHDLTEAMVGLPTSIPEVRTLDHFGDSTGESAAATDGGEVEQNTGPDARTSLEESEMRGRIKHHISNGDLELALSSRGLNHQQQTGVLTAAGDHPRDLLEYREEHGGFQDIPGIGPKAESDIEDIMPYIEAHYSASTSDPEEVIERDDQRDLTGDLADPQARLAGGERGEVEAEVEQPVEENPGGLMADQREDVGGEVETEQDGLEDFGVTEGLRDPEQGSLDSLGDSGNEDRPPVEVVMTAIGGRDTSQAIDDSAALLGVEAFRTQPPVGEVEFVDYPFSSDVHNAEKKIEIQIQRVEEHQPRIAVAPDIEGEMTLDRAAEIGDRLLDAGADEVVLVPKDVHPTEVPSRFRVGLPFADWGDSGSSHGHTVLDYAEVEQGVHVLGGAPQDQLELAEYGVPVESVDGSGIMVGAENFDIWHPDSPHYRYAGADSDLYERVEKSLDNISLAWADHYGEEHPDLDEYHVGVASLDEDVLVVNPNIIEDHEGRPGDPATTRKCWRTLVEAGVPEDAAKAVLGEFRHVYDAAVYADRTGHPHEDSREYRDGALSEENGGRLLNIEGIGPSTYDRIAALSPTRLEQYPDECEKIRYTTDGPRTHQGEFTVECGEENIAVEHNGEDWQLVHRLEDTGEQVVTDTGSRVEMTERAKEATLIKNDHDPEQHRPDVIEERPDDQGSPDLDGEEMTAVPASAPESALPDREDSPPEMFYVKGATGAQPWLQGENILLSAGVAWRNSGNSFNLTPPEEVERLFIDSGGFQATVHFGGEYPYSPRDLFEYAEEVGADYVAGMDFACETADALAEVYDDVEPADIPPVPERIDATIEKQVEQKQVYDAGEWSFEFVPVVQGLDPEDYRYCARRLREEGLADTYMAIGTVCKRESVDGILDVVEVCEDELPSTEFHLFGATKEVWKDSRFWGRFASADTHAWAMKNDDGSWVSNKEEKEQAWESYAEDIEQHREAMVEQESLGSHTSDRSAFAALLDEGIGEIECGCGTCIPAYGTDFEPRCRHCEMTHLNRQMQDMHAVDTAQNPEETHANQTQQSEL